MFFNLTRHLQENKIDTIPSTISGLTNLKYL